MRIAYVTHTRFPTEKAHGNQIAHVCAAMATLGHTVELIAPEIQNPVRSDTFEFYGLKQSFTVRYLSVFDALSAWFVPGAFAFFFTMASYTKQLKKFMQSAAYDIIYVRSPVLLPTLLQSGIPVVIELHTLPRRRRKRFTQLCSQCHTVVCLTSLMRSELISWGVPAKKVIVEADAVDLGRFRKLPGVKTLRHEWDMPEDRVIIGYVGSLVTFDSLKKGVDVILEALLELRKQRVPVFGWFVGGPNAWKEKYRKLALTMGLSSHDVRFDDAVFASSVPEILHACDICVYPAPRSKHVFFQRDTSPLKLFEYLASGTPAVVADIPPLRDVVDKTTVKLFHPGSGSSLAAAILDVMHNPAPAKERAQKGKEIVQEHTWEKRMERILKLAKRR